MKLNEAKISARVMWSLGHKADAVAWSEVTGVRGPAAALQSREG